MNTTMLKRNNLETRYMSLSDEIRNLLLEAFIEGELPAGTRVNDIEVAKKLGVSRTPVREALRALQSLGIIETLPARVTRIATLSVEEITHAQTVWASLYRILLTEIIDRIDPNHITEVLKFHNDYGRTTGDKLATLSFRLFNTLVPLSENSFLRESVNASSYRIRLGHGLLHDHAHFAIGIRDAQMKFVSAITDKHLDRAHEAVDMITSLKMPANHEIKIPSKLEQANGTWELNGRTAPASLAG